jgi:hypothetical protein
MAKVVLITTRQGSGFTYFGLYFWRGPPGDLAQGCIKRSRADPERTRGLFYFVSGDCISRAAYLERKRRKISRQLSYQGRLRRHGIFLKEGWQQLKLRTGSFAFFPGKEEGSYHQVGKGGA